MSASEKSPILSLELVTEPSVEVNVFDLRQETCVAWLVEDPTCILCPGCFGWHSSSFERSDSQFRSDLVLRRPCGGLANSAFAKFKMGHQLSLLLEKAILVSIAYP